MEKVLGINVNIVSSVEYAWTLEAELDCFWVFGLVQCHVKLVILFYKVGYIRRVFHAKFAFVDVGFVCFIEMILQEGCAGFGKADNCEVEHPRDVADYRPIWREEFFDGW